MILVDTNIIIYLGKGTRSIRAFDSAPFAYSSIARIESLGFHELPVSEARTIEQFLELGNELQLTPPTVERAIAYRQMRRMSLGDAIIAATAVEHSLPLWTANTKDFSWISELELYTPDVES